MDLSGGKRTLSRNSIRDKHASRRKYPSFGALNTEYNGIYTIQNNEINGKPWFKNNSGVSVFLNANSGGAPHGVWTTVLKTELMIGLGVVGQNHRIQAVRLWN